MNWSYIPIPYVTRSYSLRNFGKTDQFVGFSEYYSSFSCPTFAAIKTNKEMKRILTIICAIAFSGVALSAQNNVDNNCEQSQKPAYMVNVGYNRGYRADVDSYRIALNTHPLRTISSVTAPKKIPMSFQVITFLSIVASGSERPTTAIMNEMAVPRATPF